MTGGRTAAWSSHHPSAHRSTRATFIASGRCSGTVPPVKFHELRHTCVSLLLEVGVSPRVVMEIVGHAGLDMTMNTYGHVRLEVTRDALDQLGGLFIDQAQEDDEAS